MVSLIDNPDLNHLGPGLASADLLPNLFNHLGWCMLTPVKAGLCHGAQNAERLVFNLFYLFFS